MGSRDHGMVEFGVQIPMAPLAFRLPNPVLPTIGLKTQVEIRASRTHEDHQFCMGRRSLDDALSRKLAALDPLQINSAPVGMTGLQVGSPMSYL